MRVFYASAMAGFLATAAPAAVLDFSGNICDGGNVCGNGSPLD